MPRRYTRIEITAKRSRNLRSIVDRAYKVGVAKAVVHRAGAGTFVYVRFSDSSECRTTFADFTIACDWFRKRWQKWGFRCSDDYWTFQ